MKPIPHDPTGPEGRAASRGLDLVRISWRAAAILLLILLLFVHVAVIHTQAGKGGTDFDVFYASAQHVLAGEDPYLLLPGRGFIDDRIDDRTPADTTSGRILRNLNPPAFVALSAPLARLSYGHAFVLLQALTLLSLVVAVPFAAGAVERETGSAGRAILPVILVVLLAYPPTLANVAYGQVGALLVLPLALAWWSLARGSDGLAGAALGVAASVKLFCGLFLLPLLLLRRWRALATFTLTGLLLATAGLAVVGLDAHRTFLRALGQVTWTADPRNGSLAGVAARLGVPTALELAAAGAVLAILVLAIGRSRPEWRSRSGLVVGATVAGMLLLSPLAWHYYLPLLVLPAVAIWQRSGWMPRMLVVLALAMTSIIPPYRPGDTGPAWEPPPMNGWEPRFLGLLLLYAVACWTLARPASGRERDG